ncbi:MAG: ATPase [Myxococcota bacterium]
MHIIFTAPDFPASQRQFVRALAQSGAYVSGIGESAPHHLDAELKSWLGQYEQVHNISDEEAVFHAVRRIQQRGPWVHRFETTIESHMLMVARVRERTKIPGMCVDTVNLCRDKFRMKQFLHKRGIPCARHAEIRRAQDAHNFVKQNGFPVILKPRDGAGAHATYRINNQEVLQSALLETGIQHAQHAYFTMEAFVQGHEGFYDTLTCNGQVVFEGICHYYPNVLEAMRTRWISPQIVITNQIDAPGYQELRRFGREIISAFGLETTATHMEWFSQGAEPIFSEIGARPPGCYLWELYNMANDFDLYQAWAQALVHQNTQPQPSRRFAAGLIALRPKHDGVISGITGIEETYARYGDCIVRAHFPSPGTPTSPVEAGYLANAWVWVRHPNYDTCRAILDHIGQIVDVWAQ